VSRYVNARNDLERLLPRTYQNHVMYAEELVKDMSEKEAINSRVEYLESQVKQNKPKKKDRYL